MADYFESLQENYSEHIQNELRESREGVAFLMKYATSRGAISKLSQGILDLIGNSDLSTEEAIGLMEYMKHKITCLSCIPQKKEHE